MTALVSTFGGGFDHNINRLPTFSGQELFHIFDVFNQKYLENVVAEKGRPGAILSDHILLLHHDHRTELDFYGLPLWAMRECRQWNHSDFDPNQALVSTHAFNFMINKKQCSRYILLKLVEMGRYQSFQYTWSGIGRTYDMNHIINEMDQLGPGHPAGSSEFRTHILSPVDLPMRFIEENLVLHETDEKHLANDYGRIWYGGNKFTWDNFLHDMFKKSCVSLISETATGFDKQSVFTEKTLYAFFGLTFPIWVGNYGQALSVEQVGLDVFNDVIDHSYQWHPSLIERCYWAFELNKKILGDLTFAHGMRLQHIERLLINRKWLLNDGLDRYCQNQIDSMPAQFRDAAGAVKTKFDSTLSNMTSVQTDSR